MAVLGAEGSFADILRSFTENFRVFCGKYNDDQVHTGSGTMLTGMTYIGGVRWVGDHYNHDLQVQSLSGTQVQFNCNTMLTGITYIGGVRWMASAR